jgi:hypothetical protein
LEDPGLRPRQKLHETLSQPIAEHNGVNLSFQAMWENEIRRLQLHVSPGKKVSKTPSQLQQAGYGGMYLQ